MEILKIILVVCLCIVVTIIVSAIIYNVPRQPDAGNPVPVQLDASVPVPVPLQDQIATLEHALILQMKVNEATLKNATLFKDIVLRHDDAFDKQMIVLKSISEALNLAGTAMQSLETRLKELESK